MNDQEKPIEGQIVPHDSQPMVHKGPDAVIAEATERANAVKGVIDTKGLKTKIGQKEHVHFEGWCTVARFYNCVVDIEWTRPIESADGKNLGYEARAQLIDMITGQAFAHANSRCMRSEPTWRSRDDYSIESMAQTRAAGKACRMVFGWVMVLAGYAPSPAEEMVTEAREKETPPRQEKKQSSGKASKQAPDSPITAKQVSRLYAILFEGASHDEPERDARNEKLKNILSIHGWEGVAQVTAEHYEDICQQAENIKLESLSAETKQASLGGENF